MQTWEAIESRRNVRTFTDRPIPAADLDRMAELGAAWAEHDEDPADAAKGTHVLVTDAWYSMGQEAEKAIRKPVFEPYRVDQAMLDGAEADPLQAARRGDREDDIGRDRARGEKYAHQCKQADTIAGSGKKRRDAFDHRRGAEQQKQRRAAGRAVAMLMEGRSYVGVDGNHMRGCGGVVVPMEMG